MEYDHVLMNISVNARMMIGIAGFITVVFCFCPCTHTFLIHIHSVQGHLVNVEGKIYL